MSPPGRPKDECRSARRPGPRARAQRGAALLTALIIVTLVATLASAMVWQQWRAVQVEAAERARMQAVWILSGALDFARLILREDLRSGRPTALTEPWATPLAEARLSTFLAVDKANADDAPEAFLSGQITDAQARYNLTNLLNQGKVDPAEFAALLRLCQNIGVDGRVAQQLASGLRDAVASTTPSAESTTGTTGASGNAPLTPTTQAQLAWFGVDAGTLQTLVPHIVLLPGATPLNVNTASREVLAAVIPGLDMATAERLVRRRQRAPYPDMPTFLAEVASNAPVTARLDVRSSHFEVTGRLRLAEQVLTERTLLQRLPGGEFKVLSRERVASQDGPGS
jgi:general secretion pathway protein K